MPEFRIASLPIDTLLPHIIRSIERNTISILEAEPGAGETTRVPPASTNFMSATLKPILLSPY